MLRIHHYFSKSKQEWARKLTRGDVNLGPYDERTTALFTPYDKRDVNDRSAIEARNSAKPIP